MSTGHEAAVSAPNAGEYILHHLGNLNSSGHPQATIFDFSIINYDTVFFSVVTGLLCLLPMWWVAGSANISAKRSKSAICGTCRRRRAVSSTGAPSRRRANQAAWAFAQSTPRPVRMR